MPTPLVLKSLGYLVSIISVLLLGAAAWGTASKESETLACLILGMATSVVGMGFRWASTVQDHRERGNI